jgi:hypothetical protein
MNEEAIKGINYALEKFAEINKEKIRLIASNLTEKQLDIYLLGYTDALLLASFVILASGIQEALKSYEKDKSSEQAMLLILSHLLSER